MRLNVIMTEARACRACEPDLPCGPRPLLQGSTTSRLLIIGQAPGRAAHESGTPWDDRSGVRLRQWLGLDETRFYDPRLVALMPMGFCFPGAGRRGDLPPRPQCAPLWHPRLLDRLSGVRLTVYVGRHAFERYLSESYTSVTEAARACEDLLPRRIALPHPSPRNNIWLRNNPWFETEVLPRLRRRVRRALAARSTAP